MEFKNILTTTSFVKIRYIIAELYRLTVEQFPKTLTVIFVVTVLKMATETMKGSIVGANI